MAATMAARNSVSAKMAECYIYIPNEKGKKQRYNFMSAINVEVTFEKEKTEVPILGRMNKGHKSVGSSITGSAEFHMNTSIWRELAYRFQDTGEDVYFDMMIVNDDPTATDVGRQVIWLYDCNFDSILLAAFDADSDDSLTESMDFTAERFEIESSFDEAGGVKKMKK
jgi:hypothetical protein